MVEGSTVFTEDKPLPRDPEVAATVPDGDKTMTTDETRLPLEEDNDFTMETGSVRCAMEVEEMEEAAKNSDEEITFGGQDVLADPNTPMASRTLKVNVDTPGPSIDTPTMERLRPKPIDVNNITVTPQVKLSKVFILEEFNALI